jgi:hypothetical protein
LAQIGLKSAQNRWVGTETPNVFNACVKKCPAVDFSVPQLPVLSAAFDRLFRNRRGVFEPFRNNQLLIFQQVARSYGVGPRFSSIY